MKILDVLEARYYQRPPLEAIMKRTRGLINSTRGGEVWLHDTWINSLRKVKQFQAKFVIRGPRTKERVHYMVQHFLETHDIPYTEIYGIVQDTVPAGTNTRWNATMRYEPKHQNVQTYVRREEEVTEAKYYGKPSARDVVGRLKKLSKVVQYSDVVMVDDAWQHGKQVEAAFTIYNTKDRQDVEYKVKRWLDDAGIPYTEIKDLFDFSQGAETFWSATMVYNEDS